MPRARRHSDLPSATPWATTQTCLRSLGLRPGFFKRQWGNEITTPDTSQPLALNVFSVLYKKGGVCSSDLDRQD